MTNTNSRQTEQEYHISYDFTGELHRTYADVIKKRLAIYNIKVTKIRPAKFIGPDQPMIPGIVEGFIDGYKVEILKDRLIVKATEYGIEDLKFTEVKTKIKSKGNSNHLLY